MNVVRHCSEWHRAGHGDVSDGIVPLVGYHLQRDSIRAVQKTEKGQSEAPNQQ